ncbi:glycosyltransferase family 2 protein [Leptothoe sp. PORK10 BA2]|uniref:glycosyltransferase family 2 protein n=1 Tax=Leptothoe sp. PORK10 BA2 TaxID=3110254 RepID=UPI002B20CA93|nr:glycosyltransferase family 2 protein [Leptothoe sp. PORK10 BA2]MEA5465999.1 glycosyltransferase family 2 protein [Leptothoe sp. PORK10 BA2]
MPVRNRKAYTSDILRQLSNQISQYSNEHQFDVVVVDDGSTDGTPELIAQAFPSVHLVSGDGNLWWTGAIATGMTYAQQHLHPDYLVWLNDDITLADNFIAHLVQCCQLNLNQKIITGGIVCDRTHADWIVFGGVISSCPISTLQQFSDDPVLNVDALNGNIVVIPARLTQEVGLPNAERFRHYGGDYEYVCRAKAAGYTVQLSSLLKATTDWQPSDVIRYMPLWIQWYISRSMTDKLAVLKNLSNRRSPHNVEHMVNSIHRQAKHVPRWTYKVFHAKKLVKLMGSELIPRAKRRQKIEDYFRHHNVPPDVVQAVLGSVSG